MVKNEKSYLIDEFLEKVKNELPRWVKNENSMLSEVIEQLENHIWEKARELSDIKQATDESIRLAIANMGDPKTIAQEYNQESTPKVFICAGLWPKYKTTIIILLINILIINILFIVNLIIYHVNNPMVFVDDVILSIIFQSIYFNIGLFGAIGIITIVFFWLSKRGYYPESYRKHKRELKKAKKVEELIEKGMPISPETGEPLKPFIEPKSTALMGILIIIMGSLILWGAYPNITNTHIMIFIPLFIIAISSIVSAFLGNKHVLIYQIILAFMASLIILILIMLSISIVNTPALIAINFFKGIVFILFPILSFIAIAGCIYRLKKLEKYKVDK